jgi:hypothetical protein
MTTRKTKCAVSSNAMNKTIPINTAMKAQAASIISITYPFHIKKIRAFKA